MVEEELNGVIVDLKRHRLEERNVNVNEFFVEEVKVEGDKLVEKRVTQNIVYAVNAH